ncbi:MAG: C39 family peptidase, partial [Bacteroidota bacterium]
MNNISPKILPIVMFLLCSSALFAGKQTEQQRVLSSPIPTVAGVLFSDHLSCGLFLRTNTGVSTLSLMPGSDLYVSVSVDGRFAGFKEVQSDGSQLPVLVDLAGNTRSILHTAEHQIGQVSFSKNGDIAFTVGNELNIINGAAKRTIRLGTYSNITPISPDASQAVFNDRNDQLWLIDVKTQQKKMITNGEAGYALPQWSPDGSQILYTQLNGNIFVYSLQTGRTVHLGTGESPTWMNEQTIIYSEKTVERETVVSSELYSVRSDGSLRTKLTSTKDVLETDPVFDAKTNTLIYADEHRGGLYSREFVQNGVLLTEQELLSYSEHSTQRNTAAKRQQINAPMTAAAVSFEMPYVHQVWDTPDWYNGSAACGATSSIMVIAYYHLVPKWDVWCSASGSSPAHNSPYGRYVCESYTFREYGYSLTATDPNGKSSFGGYGFMWTGSFSPYSRTVEYYTNHGMTAARYDSSASFYPTVIANVDSGYPFTLCNGLTTAGHIIVVNGYDVNERTLIVNDPYGNKNTGTYPSLNGKAVKYDWVGYNNGYRNLNRIYWGVSVRASQIVRADSVVDDAHLDKGFYLHTASPSSLIRWYDKRTGGYQNNHFWWTRTKSSDTCYAVWTPSLAKDGRYDVSAYIPYSDATKARYTITTGNGPVE